MNNEPAFPLQSIGPDFAPGWSGMQLRDYFAAKAMQGGIHNQPAGDAKDWAKWAYKVADEMMKARSES